jgi:hypothetical protein
MHWKKFGRRCDLIETLAALKRKPRRTSVKQPTIFADIWTRNLPNTSLVTHFGVWWERICLCILEKHTVCIFRVRILLFSNSSQWKQGLRHRDSLTSHCGCDFRELLLVCIQYRLHTASYLTVHFYVVFAVVICNSALIPSFDIHILSLQLA